MMWGGFKAWPMTQLRGCSQADCMTLIVSSAELEAMIESGGAALSISANNLILSSLCSGVLSWTKSASAEACLTSAVNQRCSGDAFGETPRVASAGHAV